jgi:hypothetical protein
MPSILWHSDEEDDDPDFDRIIDVFINGTNLVEITRLYELNVVDQTEREIAGQYAGLPFDELRENLNQTETLSEIQVIGCTCGISGCWPLLMDLSKTSQSVKWSNFKNPHRDTGCKTVWDYSNFPSFQFEHTHYNHALAHLEVLTNTLLKENDTNAQ